MSLEQFFNPKGIAVIGASTDPGKLGYGVARNLIQGGYPGVVHLVNPKGGALFGHQMQSSVSVLPNPVDLAVVIVPAQAAPQTLREIGQRGIRAAILASGGFKETGPAGAKLEAEVVQICHEYGIRLLGPNCIGLLDTHLPFDTTFLPPPPPPRGRLAFLSHSGAFCAAVVDWSRAQGFGFSRLVSLGNQADVTETDLLPVIAADPHTRAICLYLESMADGGRFIETVRAVTSHKAVVAMKVGRTESGQQAAASHTGALASSDIAFSAALEKAGAFRADTAEQMFDWAQALAACPLPKGRRIGILTNAGGPGVIAADALEAEGLELARFSAPTLSHLKEILPAAGSARNPVDMLASASPQLYADCLSALLAEPGVDGVIVIAPPSPNHPTEAIAEGLIPLITRAKKPALVALMGFQLVDAARARFAEAGIPTYPFPERAASALGALWRRGNELKRRRLDEGRTTLGGDGGRTTVDQKSGGARPILDLLEQYGIAVARLELARSAGEAAELAGRIGFPLVMKVASADIAHKSDVGGVLLDIGSAGEAASAYELLMERAKTTRPAARIEGVHLQRQVEAGQEVIVGMRRDAQFGALMMFGSGGVEVEGLKDLAFGLGPLTEAEAREMLGKTWAGRRLGGFRSIPAADAQAVIEVLIRLSRLAVDFPKIEEIEINPLRVLSRGAVAVDVRARGRELF
jgi:acetyltransferase